MQNFTFKMKFVRIHRYNFILVMERLLVNGEIRSKNRIIKGEKNKEILPLQGKL